MKKFIITKNDLLSGLAYCAVRQSPYEYPSNLQEALKDAAKFLDDLDIFKSRDKQSIDSYLHVDSKELRQITDDLVKKVPSIAIWNVTKMEQDNGITDPEDPKRSVKFSFVSRSSYPAADCDFIDLDALSRNIMNMIEPLEERSTVSEIK